MAVAYQQIYNEDYFNGKSSFFWMGGYGGYGLLGKNYFNNLFRPLTPYLITKRGATVLDIGCAYGFMLERFPQNYRKFGVDVSAHAISVAEKRLPEGVFKVAGIESRVPYKKDFFDTIICNDVLEHLEKPKKALEQMWLSLRPRGILYLTTPNYNFLRKTLFVYPDKKEHHISLLPHQQLLDLLSEIGFKVIDHWTFFHLGLYLRRDSNTGVESAIIARK
jgi:2-polyprenyl-3-methyl-5-hydroxy-6-metoxy-1,4-benzoquinol methylase